mgnify:CR=1 FL=1
MTIFTVTLNAAVDQIDSHIGKFKLATVGIGGAIFEDKMHHGTILGVLQLS